MKLSYHFLPLTWNFSYCSLDSGWSVGGNGDENGRIIADSSLFNMPDLANHLHGEGVS